MKRSNVLKIFYEAFSHHMDMFFSYKDEEYHLDFQEKSCTVFSKTLGKNIFECDLNESADYVLDNCFIDEKPLKNILHKMDDFQA